jgi:hypothetical protein
MEDVGVEVLTAVTGKSTVFWDVAPCSLLEVQRNTVPPSSGSKSKPSKHEARSKH